MLLYQNPIDMNQRLVLPNIKEIIEGLLFEYRGDECYCEIVIEIFWLSLTTINKIIYVSNIKVNTQTIVNDKAFVHVVFPL